MAYPYPASSTAASNSFCAALCLPRVVFISIYRPDRSPDGTERNKSATPVTAPSSFSRLQVRARCSGVPFRTTPLRDEKRSFRYFGYCIRNQRTQAACNLDSSCRIIGFLSRRATSVRFQGLPLPLLSLVAPSGKRVKLPPAGFFCCLNIHQLAAAVK